MAERFSYKFWGWNDFHDTMLEVDLREGSVMVSKLDRMQADYEFDYLPDAGISVPYEAIDWLIEQLQAAKKAQQANVMPRSDTYLGSRLREIRAERNRLAAMNAVLLEYAQRDVDWNGNEGYCNAELNKALAPFGLRLEPREEEACADKACIGGVLLSHKREVVRPCNICGGTAWRAGQ